MVWEFTVCYEPGGSTTQGSLWADQVPQLISPRVLLCFLSDCSNAKTNPGRAAQSFSRLGFKGLWSIGHIEEGKYQGNHESFFPSFFSCVTYLESWISFSFP